MLRRLFFLLPDVEKTRKIIGELGSYGVRKHQMHVIGKGVELTGLPEATERQKRDTAFRLEWFVWNTNLAVFTAATAALLASLLISNLLMMLISLLLMLLTFVAGERFAVRVPNVHLTEFTDALKHGEVLLMVDVPAYRVADIEAYVHRGHPESVPGGVSWAVNAFGL